MSNEAETKALELLRASGYEAVADTIHKLLLQKWAETEAKGLLQQAGVKYLQQIDWLGYKDDEWTAYEIKGKDLFTPGRNFPDFPHYGIGLNKNQLWLRTQLLNALSWRTYLMNYVPGTDKVYGAYLDELEKGKFQDTNGIRMYPLSNFKAIQAPNLN